MKITLAPFLALLPLLGMGLPAHADDESRNRNSRAAAAQDRAVQAPQRGGPRFVGPRQPESRRADSRSHGDRGGDWGDRGYHHRDDDRDWGYRYAGRSHTSFGLYLGGPVYGDPFWNPRPWGYYPPYYYEPAPRTVIIEREPPVYIQRDPVVVNPQPSAPPAPQLWYYCQKPAGYYPYVPQCEQQWIPVDPASLPPISTPR